MIKFGKALPGLGNSYEGPDDEFVRDREHGDSGGQDDAGADEQKEEEEELEDSGEGGEQ